jgi:hypothetical protein
MYLANNTRSDIAFTVNLLRCLMLSLRYTGSRSFLSEKLRYEFHWLCRC